MAGSSFLMERQQEQKLRDSFSIFRVSLFSMYLMDEMIWLLTVLNSWLWRLLPRPSHCFLDLKRISLIPRLE
ncbi:MAG: hypothetical protein PUI29_01260 [Aeromonadales bacterium]|nr:hypothetical protein [Aeromonadales bacterium]MDY2891961.1 hypothetical protein [Succinivibrio sp.]